MTSGGSRFANRRVQTVLEAIIRTTRPGGILKTPAIADRINNEDLRRYFTNKRIGMLLAAREDVIRVGDGLWVVK